MAQKANEINLLFTSAGRRVELIRGFKTAYRELSLKGRLIAVDMDPLAPALRSADRAYIVPRIQSDDYIPALVDICQSEKVTLIFPLIDPDIPVLCEHRNELEKTGARVAVVSREAASIAGDKWETVQFFNRIGLKTPQSWLPEQMNPTQARFPLFIKPRNGSAGIHSFKVSNGEELSFFTGYVPHPIIQEFISGPEITSDVVCDIEGELLSVVSRRRIEVRWGEVVKGVTLNDPVILDSCIRIAGALQAKGPITVQCLINPNGHYFTEINTRLGGGFPLGVAAGASSPKWILARAAGIPVTIPPLGSYRNGIYMTRFDESFFLSENDIQGIPEFGKC